MTDRWPPARQRDGHSSPGNANPNHGRKPLHSPWNGSHQKGKKNSKCWPRCEQGDPLTLRLGRQSAAATPESSTDSPQKVTNAATLRPRDCTWECAFRGSGIWSSKRCLHPHIHRSTTYKSEDAASLRAHPGRTADGERQCAHTTVHAATGQEGNLAICNHTAGPRGP